MGTEGFMTWVKAGGHPILVQTGSFLGKYVFHSNFWVGKGGKRIFRGGKHGIYGEEGFI